VEQVSLNIIPRLPYSSGNFVIHEGVKETFDSIFSVISKNNFNICFVEGSTRSGKTHLLVTLSDFLTSSKIYHRIGEGTEFSSIALELELNYSSNKPAVILIDDIHEYLLTINPGQSGQFVSFIELCKRIGTALVFFSSKSILDLPCDDHVKSRLRAGMQFEISDPSDSDLADILNSLAKQRGVKLSKRNIDFLHKRLSRDIPSLEHYLDRLLHLSQVLGKTIKMGIISDAI